MDAVRSPKKPQGATGEAKVARLFGLKGDNWMRHANALSVWSRFSVVSLIAISIWSRDWLGWFALIPLALSLIWLMINPIFFHAPKSTRNWASKSVLGEHIWTQRNEVQLPSEFKSAVPNLANGAGLIGVLLLGYGLVEFDLIATVAGILITHLSKLWYLDRMVLLFERMKKTSPEYAGWEY